MGNSKSKPENNGSHIFSGETPVQVSYGLLNALQQTAESDSIRAKSLELELQSKIASELSRMQEQEQSIVKASQNDIDSATSESQSTLDRRTVSDSISKLSEKLSSQSSTFAESEDVGKAKSALVNCLRKNDRRPLDCWNEVETFKREVSKMEKQFVGRLLGDD